MSLFDQKLWFKCTSDIFDDLKFRKYKLLLSELLIHPINNLLNFGIDRIDFNEISGRPEFLSGPIGFGPGGSEINRARFGSDKNQIGSDLGGYLKKKFSRPKKTISIIYEFTAAAKTKKRTYIPTYPTDVNDNYETP